MANFLFVLEWAFTILYGTFGINFGINKLVKYPRPIWLTVWANFKFKTATFKVNTMNCLILLNCFLIFAKYKLVICFSTLTLFLYCHIIFLIYFDRTFLLFFLHINLPTSSKSPRFGWLIGPKIAITLSIFAWFSSHEYVFVCLFCPDHIFRPLCSNRTFYVCFILMIKSLLIYRQKIHILLITSHKRIARYISTSWESNN